MTVTQRIEEISADTGFAIRTVWDWYRQGCDINDTSSVEWFAAGKKGKPPGTETPSNDPAIDLSALPDPSSEGAAAALKRIQEFELQFAADLKSARKSGSEDEKRAARINYVEMALTLRQYEAAVKQSDRLLGNLIPLHEAVRGAQAATYYVWQSIVRWFGANLPELIAHSDPREAQKFFNDTYRDVLKVVVHDSQKSNFQIPAWAMEPIFGELHLDVEPNVGPSPELIAQLNAYEKNAKLTFRPGSHFNVPGTSEDTNIMLAESKATGKPNPALEQIWNDWIASDASADWRSKGYGDYPGARSR
jgi:hypothetical protein